jgi:hypothetical protein
VSHASTADTATNAANAAALGGIPASGYAHSDCASKTGQIKGFARIAASPTFSSAFTTNGVENPYNCSVGTVEPRRVSQGLYEVRFNGSPVVFAVASAFSTKDIFPDVASIGRDPTGPAADFKIEVYDASINSEVDDPFVILTP